MDFSVTKIQYSETGYFSKIVKDYLNRNSFLRQFYVHTPDAAGIKAAIDARKKFPTNRMLLMEVLTQQYNGIALTAVQQKNIKLLLNENTFTITTAHQPNIFTGPLYFIYKIFHVIKLATELKQQMSENNFVPVYYMGSEDADLDELGFIYLDKKKMVWQTAQTGAVGRMKVDKNFLSLIDEIYGRIGVNTFGKEIADLFKQSYTLHKTIQQATLELVNALFAEYGLLVVIPDNARLKKSFQPVIEKEITEQFSHAIVERTIEQLSSEYKIQTAGRELNLFYLIDDKRERIEVFGSMFQVLGLKIEWNKEEILKELNLHPERFSANVILRGVFQETILPNIAFVGGGGELAYWLELKNVFEAVQVPYPVLLVRNSFAFANKNRLEKFKDLGFEIKDLFKPADELLNILVKQQSVQLLSLEKEIDDMNRLYESIQHSVSAIDITLSTHTKALQAKALKRLKELEKKMLRAEKKKFEVQKNHINAIKAYLFPDDSLQERTENIALFYSNYGKDFMRMIYKTSKGLAQQFEVIEIH
jgi:bacillithiol biosynthesis cysteine-adding enzyme BshC